MILDAYQRGACEDITFVPIYIGYDRVLEEQSYIHEIEHFLHIDQRLLDLAIDKAEEPEGLIKLHQIGVGHDEGAQGQGAGNDAVRRHQHDGDETRGDDDCLADVE